MRSRINADFKQTAQLTSISYTRVVLGKIFRSLFIRFTAYRKANSNSASSSSGSNFWAFRCHCFIEVIDVSDLELEFFSRLLLLLYLWNIAPFRDGKCEKKLLFSMNVVKSIPAHNIYQTLIFGLQTFLSSTHSVSKWTCD